MEGPHGGGNRTTPAREEGMQSRHAGGSQSVDGRRWTSFSRINIPLQLEPTVNGDGAVATRAVVRSRCKTRIWRVDAQQGTTDNRSFFG